MQDQTINLLHDERGMYTGEALLLLERAAENAAERLGLHLGISVDAGQDPHTGWQLSLSIPETNLYMLIGHIDGSWGATTMVGEEEFVANYASDLPAHLTSGELLSRWALMAVGQAKADYAIELSTQEGIASIADMPGEDSSAYAEHMQEMEESSERMEQRAGQKPPREHGSEMGPLAYFCEPCWRSGDATGAHEFDVPPCDFEARGPFDPR